MSSRGSHVQIENLSHRYGFGREFVLKDVLLTIEPGQRVALVGRSGCGKSTLLQLISGLVRPSEGAIHIDGSRVVGPSPKWNVMFQKPSLYPWMTVEQNASLGMMIAGEQTIAGDRVAGLLELVGLAEYANVNVQQLSGGQQQRVALARSLSTRPELLMLDEPFAALDEITRSAMQQDVTRITRQFEMTQILVTHDIDEAITMADRLLVMSSSPGQIVADILNEGSIDEMKKQVREFLGTEVLSQAINEPSSVPDLGIHRETAQL